MKSLNQMNELLDAHHDELTELFKQQCKDEYQHRKDINFLTIILVLLVAFTCGMNVWLSNRLSQAERNIEAMGKDLIEWKDIMGDVNQETKMNSVDLDQLVCELRDSGHIDKGWTCQLYDEAD